MPNAETTMRKCILTILILTTWATFSAGQNLVPNPSFETFTSCPTFGGQLSLATPWVALPINNVEYFNACAPAGVWSVPYQGGSGFQYAHSGNAIAAFWMLNGYGGNYREYLQVALSDTLINLQCYYVSFYINLFNATKYAVNNFGLYFSNNTFTTTGSPAPYSPQVLSFNGKIYSDTLNWEKVQGVYVANGNERYITIGNFFDDYNTDTVNTGNGTYSGAYYYIDDISVIPIDSIVGGISANAGNDTSVVIGDSVFIGQEISNLYCNWYIGSTLIADSISGLYVNPTVNTTYIVEQDLCGTITYDTINIIVLPVGINENGLASKIKLYPNPFTNVATLQFDNSTKQNCTLTLYDLRGQVVRTMKNITADKVEIERQNLINGLYFFQLRTERQIIATGKLTIE